MVLQIGIVIFTWILFISSVEGIRGGFDATRKQYPYHAGIVVSDENSHKTSCGGAVIHSQFVVTSYGCVSRGKSFLITLGCVHDPIDCKRVRSLKFHIPLMDTNVTTPRNFVALLQTIETIYFNDYIQPASLPPDYSVSSGIQYTNTFANVTGYSDWGKYLQWLPMKVLNNSQCTDHFTEDSLQYSLCTTRGEDRDGNKGGCLCSDANVPLVHNNTLIGILKESDRTSCENELNLFIDVQYFANWINNTVSNISTGLSQHNVSVNEFSYHAHIEVHLDIHRNNCSGAVISTKLVLSTHRCVWNGTSFRIKLGYLNPDNAVDKPAYDHVTHCLANVDDLALLVLQTAIIFGESIQPVTLPKPGDNFYNDNYYYYAIATGYFRDLPRQLQWANTAVLTDRACNVRYPGTNQSVLDASLCVLAAYGVREDNLCNDHGVPLVVINTERKILVGMSEGPVGPNMTCFYQSHHLIFIDVQKKAQQIESVKSLLFITD